MTEHAVTLSLMVQGVQGRCVGQHQVWRRVAAHLLQLLGSLASTAAWSLASSADDSHRQQMLNFAIVPSGPPGVATGCFPGSGREKVGRKQRGTPIADISDPNT